MTYSFLNDYSEGAHPHILEALSKTNLDQESGYGEDSITLRAKKRMFQEFQDASVDIHFVSGGTQANIIGLSSMLRSFEAVICADTGHINVHEAGAIEATGHKVLTAPHVDGKLTVEAIQKVIQFHEDEHMVLPRVVFVSNATELGTVYSKKELSELSRYCKENNLFFYLDGARIGSAIAAEDGLCFANLVQLCDMFYVGGTKNGALFGEAIVIVNDSLKKDFRFHLKQRGALLAKGRAIGTQFDVLFDNGLFLELSRHANSMAEKLSKGISDLGYRFLSDSKTNLLFPVFPKQIIEALQKSFGFYVWSEIDAQHASVRLVTSWATKEDQVDAFLESLRQQS